MTKTKYEVYKRSGLVISYVTEKRNAEDMLQQIRNIHETIDMYGETNYIKVVQVIGDVRKTIYTPSNKKFWDKNLVVS